MKAIIYEKYGTPEVIELKEVEKPVPNDDEVLVKVHAASLNAYDWHFLTADIFLIRLMAGGIFRPKRTSLGTDFAGRVEAVGENIHQFAPGDAVYGQAYGDGGGAFGEFVVVPEKRIAPKPANLSFEQAAAVPMAGLTALQGLRDKGGIQAGQKVIIQGASGGVGTFAVQIAKTFGAEVTAVCSTRNLEQARGLGADHVIDYTQEDFTQNGQQYNLIFAANGYHPISAYKRALAPQGVYIMAGGTVKQLFQGVALGSWMSRGGDKKMGSFTAETNQNDLITLKGILEAGKIIPVIDRTYPLSETAEAMRYLGQGHARGKIVIRVAQDGDSEENP